MIKLKDNMPSTSRGVIIDYVNGDPVVKWNWDPNPLHHSYDFIHDNHELDLEGIFNKDLKGLIDD